MRTVARNLFVCLAPTFVGCSLVTDFPDHPPRQDAGMDAGDEPDERDARADAMPRDARPQEDATRPDGSQSDVCASNASCEGDQLCCPSADGSARMCTAVSAQSCTECGVPCSSPSAPNCGARVCECVAGSGQGCVMGELCAGTGSEARCVQCTTDADCSGMEGRGQCVNDRCVQCDRGALAEDASDDEGCSGATPVCGADNTCVGCDDAQPATACPGEQVCNPGQGCSGCSLTAPLGMNSCTSPTAPICKMVGGVTQCAGCSANSECVLNGAPGYCVESLGRCTAACDPESASGNGCSGATPFCKPTASDYACAACVPSDCTGTTPFCSGEGQTAGTCVQCRNNTDCPQNGSTPICGVNGQCRPRVAADCVAPTPILLGGQCVQCDVDAACAGNPAGAKCNPVTHVCGQCNSSADCPASAPSCNTTTATCGACTDAICAALSQPPGALVCDPTSGACVACVTSANCTANPLLPICVMNACVACNSPGVLNGDAACGAKIGGSTCVTMGATAGSCQTGGAPAACDPATDMGCTGAAPYCVAVPAPLQDTFGPAVCQSCDNVPVSGAYPGCPAGQVCEPSLSPFGYSCQPATGNGNGNGNGND